MNNKNKTSYLLMGIVIGISIVFIGSLLFSSNNENIRKPNHNENEEVDKHSKEEIIILDDQEIIEQGILVSKVKDRTLKIFRDFTGEIVPITNKLAHIVPRFAGVVKNINKKIGDKVSKGDVIAVIESNESLVTYEVKSSIEGVVLELHMTPGESINNDKNVVTIADLSSVWAELNVYQKDLNKIKIGQVSQIYFNIIENSTTASIFYISPTVNEVTRTSIARVKLNNKNGYWKPGMFINSKVLIDNIKVQKAIEKSAVQNIENKKIVFVKHKKGYKPQHIIIGRTDQNYAEILDGLENEQSYISKGAFVFKSELLKESFGGGHSH